MKTWTIEARITNRKGESRIVRNVQAASRFGALRSLVSEARAWGWADWQLIRCERQLSRGEARNMELSWRTDYAA